jgi:hypothetical protein
MTEHEQDKPMAAGEGSQRSGRRLARVACGAAIVAALAVGGIVGGRHWLKQQTQPEVPKSSEQVAAGISHGDVIRHLPAYVNDTLHREDAEIYELVFMHLQECSTCDAKKKELQESQEAAGREAEAASK